MLVLDPPAGQVSSLLFLQPMARGGGPAGGGHGGGVAAQAMATFAAGAFPDSHHLRLLHEGEWTGVLERAPRACTHRASSLMCMA